MNEPLTYIPAPKLETAFDLSRLPPFSWYPLTAFDSTIRELRAEWRLLRASWAYRPESRYMRGDRMMARPGQAR